MYHGGTYTSTDWGETWRDVSEEWWDGNRIDSMTEFKGYLWSALSITGMHRSLDHGQTWEALARFKLGRVNDWAVFNNRLYVAGQAGIGRWNEKEQTWEYLMKGLPTGSSNDSDDPPYTNNLAVLGGRLFAGLNDHGVYVFDYLGENLVFRRTERAFGFCAPIVQILTVRGYTEERYLLCWNPQGATACKGRYDVGTRETGGSPERLNHQS